MEITNLGKADGLPPVDWAAPPDPRSPDHHGDDTRATAPELARMSDGFKTESARR